MKSIEVGAKGRGVDKLLALLLPQTLDEVVIVHHYTELENRVQLEVERRDQDKVWFSREYLDTNF